MECDVTCGRSVRVRFGSRLRRMAGQPRIETWDSRAIKGLQTTLPTDVGRRTARDRSGV